MIKGTESMSMDSRLEGEEETNMVTLWDNLLACLASHFKSIFTARCLLLDTKFHAAQSRILSLQRLLEKPFHHHIRTITRIAWSRRHSQFLERKFQVVLVPANQHDKSPGRRSSLTYFLQETRRSRASRTESTMSYWSG